MLKYILTLFISLQLITSAQTFEWVKSYATGINLNPSFINSALDTDDHGNSASSHVISYRMIFGTLYLGDYKIVKHSPSGNIIWQHTLFGEGHISRLSFDNSGNLFGIGSFRDTVYFNSTHFLTANPINTENFIFKISSNGNILWLKLMSELSPQIYYEPDMTVDASGNIIITSSDDQLNSTIKKFNNDGILISTIMQTDVRYIGSAAVDPSGNLWVTGTTFNGNVSFNGYNSIAPFSYNEYVVKYSPAGVCQWVQFIRDITLQDFSIITDNSGNAYLSGNLLDSTHFGNIPAQGPRWVYDFFVTKIDPDGNFLWLREVPFDNTTGDAAAGNGNIISYSDDDNVFFTGFLRNSVNFGNGITMNSIGSNDVMVLKYSSSGELLWGKNAGSFNEETGISVAAGNNGDIFVTGRIREQAFFDTITVNGSAMNTFVAKINESIIPVELTSFTASANESGVLLSWTTSTEKNNKGFEIERCVDEVNGWITIGFKEGKGTTAETSVYNFIDDDILTGYVKYRLKQIDYDGSFKYSDVAEVEVNNQLNFALMQNYPNPFNPSTKIRYSIPDNAGHVTLKIYDILGNELAVLVNDVKSPGIYEAEFNASKLTSGIYFYRLSADKYTEVKKLMVVK